MNHLTKCLLGITLLLSAACSKEENTTPLMPAGITLNITEFALAPGATATLRMTISPAEANIAPTDFALADATTGQVPVNVEIQSTTPVSEGSFDLIIRDKKSNSKYSESLKIVHSLTGISSEAFTVRSQSYMPVVYVTSEQSVTSKDIWVKGSIRIDGGNAFDNLEQMVIEIKGRGNSTWSWEKKPYALKLDSKKEVLGMPKHKRWCLIANYMDRTQLRNRVAYYIGQHSNLAWTVRNEYVELYFNGSYQGLYLLTEQIKEDPNRVNITEIKTADNSGEAVTGGYLLEMDTNYDELKKFRTTSTNIPVNIKYPDPEELTDPQFAYIRDYVNKIDAIVSGKTQGDPFDYLDRQSLIDYWIIFEATANHEILHPKSIYFHKDRGGKLIAGPVWDFDYETLVEHTQTMWINYNLSYRPNEFPWYHNNWWNKLLMTDVSFRADVKRRWQEWYPFLKSVPAFIDSEQKAIAEAVTRNNQRWPSINGTGNPNRDEKLSFPNAVSKLKSVYTTRLEWMNREIAKW